MKTTNDRTYIFKISGLPHNDLVYSNNIFLHPEDFNRVATENGSKDKIFMLLKGFLFSVQKCNDVVKGYVSLSKIFRDMVQIPGTGEVSVSCKTISLLRLGFEY